MIELIISFHGAGTVSFMGLSITRNSIICLNHLLYQMQINFNKNVSIIIISRIKKNLICINIFRFLRNFGMKKIVR